MKAIGRNLIIEKTKEGTTKTKGGLLLAENQREDIRYTKELVRAGRILGIQVLDHIIASAEGGKSIRCYYPHIFE